ncbi:hypothetical protein HA402_005470 [Bradysia odoriphaga]|nr:hypothetical protein HA402_005470 [Bradysia odoriphaga]
MQQYSFNFAAMTSSYQNFNNVLKISQCIEYLLGNKLYSDIEFRFKNSNVTFNGHKFIIGLRSTVFHTMFYGSIPANQICEIEDIQPTIFWNMLQFIYTDEVSICEQNYAELMYAAHKYSLNCLEKACCLFVIRKLNADNCCSYLQQCFLYNNDLTKKCYDVIDKEIRQIIQKINWKDLNENQMIAILRRDTLDISECELFEGVMAWAKHICEKKGVDLNKINIRELFIVFELVRFPTMSLAEFSEFHQNNKNFLESGEIADIFQYINAGIVSPSMRYSTVKRRYYQPSAPKKRHQKLHK